MSTLPAAARPLVLTLVLLTTAAVCAPPARDTQSDSVGATAGSFRVDESGNATYSVPILAVPGTAGVQPELALSYSSQAGVGPLGKGWSISGQSAITRCRRSREAGDYFVAGAPADGNPGPISYTNGDVFCLDGQRLLLVSGNQGSDGAEYRPELDPWTRVRSYGGSNTSGGTYTGPAWFQVDRKDGSSSWYGDLPAEFGDSNDTRMVRVPTVVNAAITAWPINRFEDSTGNFIRYRYQRLGGEGALNAATEYVLSAVEYTGKRQLAGQTQGAWEPFVAIRFHYSTAPWQSGLGYQGGVRFEQTQRLDAVEVEDLTGAGTLRWYALDYETSASGSGVPILSSLQECRDATLAVCYAPTAFTWSQAQAAIAPGMTLAGANFRDASSVRVGDVDGDGRQDIAFFGSAGSGCATDQGKLFVAFADVDSSNRLVFTTAGQTPFCSAKNEAGVEDNWQLLDYDGDGRDDLLVAGTPIDTQRWHVHRSQGRTSTPINAGAQVFAGSDLLAGLDTPIPAGQDGYRFLHLADVNGDGLQDAFYGRRGPDPSSPPEMKVRLAERSGAALGWGGERTVVRSEPVGSVCSSMEDCLFALAPTFLSSTRLLDLNGDARSDFLFLVRRQECTEPQGTPADPEDGALPTPLVPLPQLGGDDPGQDGIGCQLQDKHLLAYTTQSVSGTQVVLAPQFAWTDTQSPSFHDALSTRFGDVNGDGLTDVLLRDAGPSWSLWLNTGAGFLLQGGLGSVGSVPNEIYAQLNDLDGDGRTELVYPSGSGFVRRRPQEVSAGTLGFGPASAIPGGGATAPSLSTAIHLLQDFDGDGATDFARLDVSASNAYYTARPPVGSRFVVRDTLTGIADGYGARTALHYQPLTNRAVYQRGTGARSWSYGRGSPVLDLLAPSYVVSRVDSSAAIDGDLEAMATVRYRYAGSRIQAGGRGFLGFAEITSFDANQGNQTVITRTTYLQEFPHVGRPDTTTRTVRSGGFTLGRAYLDHCHAHADRGDVECLTELSASGAPVDYTNRGTREVWPALGGTDISASISVWACQGTGDGAVCPVTEIRQVCLDVMAPSALGFDPLGSQQPVFPYLIGTAEYAMDPETGNPLSSVYSAFCHAEGPSGFGNVVFTQLDHRDGNNLPVLVKTTRNTYANDAAAWRLGRLTASTVEESRDCSPGTAGASPNCSAWTSRQSRFAYDGGSADTGLLTKQQIQPSGTATEDLRTLTTRDDFGNTIAEYRCSRDVGTDAQCRSTAIEQRPLGVNGPATRVHRFALHEYDTRGRFLVATRLPYFNGGSGSGVTVQDAFRIAARDEFGNAIQRTEASGRVTEVRFGAMGRPYWQGDSTGASVTTRFRWCSGTVPCPDGTVFRTETAPAGGARTWTYHDRLGRATLAVAETFNAGASGKDLSATCRFHDAKGRPERSSVPFFLPGTAGGAAPSATQVGGTPCASALWTLTDHDVLGRPVAVTAADFSTTRWDYRDLVATETNAKGQITETTKNALGEVVAVRQPLPAGGGLGMVTQFVHDSRGNLVESGAMPATATSSPSTCTTRSDG